MPDTNVKYLFLENFKKEIEKNLNTIYNSVEEIRLATSIKELDGQKGKFFSDIHFAQSNLEHELYKFFTQTKEKLTDQTKEIKELRSLIQTYKDCPSDFLGSNISFNSSTGGFLADTLILLSDNSVWTVEDIYNHLQEGGLDFAVAFDYENNFSAFKSKILEVIKTPETDQLIKLSLLQDTKGHNYLQKEITCHPDQMFRVGKGDKGFWVKAKDLSPDTEFGLAYHFTPRYIGNGYSCIVTKVSPLTVEKTALYKLVIETGDAFVLGTDFYVHV